MRDITLDGLWWLPNDPETKVAGTVSFAGDTGPTLRLIGAFWREEQTSTGAYNLTLPEAHPLIHGLCEQGEVTLVDCGPGGGVRRHLGSPLRWRQSLQARLMLVGILLAQPDETYFDRIVVGVDHLLAWSGLSGIIGDDDGSGYRWAEQESLVAALGETTVWLSLGWGTDAKFWADRNERTISESAGFVVDVPEPRSADALITEWVKPLQDLLTLATGRACGVHEITLIRRRPEQGSNEAAARPWRPVRVDAYLQPVYRSQPDERAMVHERMLFNLRHMPPFSEVLPAWLAVNERLGPVPAMLFGLRYRGRSYVENRLITAVAAAEALHRRLLPDATYLSEEEYGQLRSAALAVVPEQHREWLGNRIWNEPTLKRRLMGLVDRLGTDLVEPFMPRPNRWANDAKDARNALVHRSPDLEPPGGEGMYVLAQMTTAVITLNLLHEIGVPRGRLDTIVRSNDLFRWITEEGPKLMPRLFT
jgi:hypothetical protein